MLLQCVHRAWVFFPAISRCCLHFGTLCVRSLVHQYITEVRDLWGRKERVTLRIRKNKAIRKVIKIEQLLMQPLFYSFCCHVLEKRGVWNQKAGLLLISWLPWGSPTMRNFLFFQGTKKSLMQHCLCPAISLSPASQFEESCFSLYFHSCWND